MGENTFEVFQTLEDRNDDIETIEKIGPIKAFDTCPAAGEETSNRRDTWLGEGYYFWETDQEHAHWWGKIVKRHDYKSGYIICKALYDFSPENCFDLFGNTKHKKVFRGFYENMQKQGLGNQKTIAKEVFSFMRKNMKQFEKFKAIRVETAYINNSKNETYTMRVPFYSGAPNNSSVANLEAISRVQICFFELDSFNLRNFTKVYPVEQLVDVNSVEGLV